MHFGDNHGGNTILAILVAVADCTPILVAVSKQRAKWLSTVAVNVFDEDAFHFEADLIGKCIQMNKNMTWVDRKMSIKCFLLFLSRCDYKM